MNRSLFSLLSLFSLTMSSLAWAGGFPDAKSPNQASFIMGGFLPALPQADKKAPEKAKKLTQVAPPQKMDSPTQMGFPQQASTGLHTDGLEKADPVPQPPSQAQYLTNRQIASDTPPPAPFDPTKVQPYVASIDIYGTKRVSPAQLKKILGQDLDTWIKLGLDGNEQALAWEKKIVEKISKQWDFAVSEWTILQYFKPGDAAIHMTLDVVEKKDLQRRMPFKPVPTGAYPDPDRMIEKWLDYEEKALSLMDQGDLTAAQAKCKRAFHCPFGHKHPELKSYEAFFTSGVKKNLEKLIQIQKKDRRPEYRAVATYLLPYLADGKKVVGYMMDGISDPNPSVRNNALRVLGDIAEFHPHLSIPLTPLLEALDYPRVSDRSKAAYVIYGLSTHSASIRKTLLKKGIDPLLALMDSQQPSQYEVAHIILRKLTGKNFRPQNLAAWRKWFSRAPAEQ